MKIRYGIIGAYGITGQELLQLASQDKRLECVFCSSSQDAINETMLQKKPDVVFFATPHGVCMQYAPFFLSHQCKVIDLSGDFRFQDHKLFEKTYHIPHQCPEQKAIFGITEWVQNDLPTASLVANPGCYVTGSLLPLLPLQHFCQHIVIDGKSGYSGAGKNFERTQELKVNVCIPYTLTKHRHEAEIQQFFSCPVSFTPHLLNIFQGMLITIHAFIKPEFRHINFLEVVQQQYQDSLLVRVQKAIPNIAAVQKTNQCIIGGFESDENGRLVIISVLDNLRKGAVSQALQNMYAMFSMPLPSSFYEKT